MSGNGRVRVECPYCGDKVRGRDALRIHVATNLCGKVPEHVALAYDAGERKDTSEAGFQKLVTQVADAHGWRWFHVERGRGRDGHWLTATTGAPGVPDLWLVRGGVLIVLELKRATGSRDRPGQAEWIAELAQVPGCTAIMGASPDHWPHLQALLTADDHPGVHTAVQSPPPTATDRSPTP